MTVLVLGGTRFFGVPMIEALLEAGHEVTIASRGLTPDRFGGQVQRIILDRSDPDSLRSALSGRYYHTVIDKLAYCSNDIRNIMDVLDCGRYIQMSTTAVYDPKHMNTVEEDYCGLGKELIWCDRPDFSYEVVKRQAENALWQCYDDRSWTAVRYPVVLGQDDYTRRLYFYVEHTITGTPMHIDNLHRQMGYIHSGEAGRFLAFLADRDFSGPINGCSHGTISIGEMLEYVEKKTGTNAVITPDGDPAPYNGEPEFSINTDKAQALGFEFSRLHHWIFDLLDYYINEIKAK